MISVVIPTYNRADLVGRAVESVLAQNGPIDVVVVDDGSTDDTPGVIAALANERLRYLRLANGGGTRARNAGARASTGELLAFLDDDDELYPAWADEMRGPLERDPSIAIVCCGAIHLTLDGGFVALKPPVDLGPVFDGVRGRFDTGTYLLRRSAFDAVDGFVDGLGSNPHTELALRLVEHCRLAGARVAAVDETLVTVYDRDPTQRTRNHPRRRYDAALYLVEHHRDRLQRSPRMLGDHLAIAGVSAARLGDFAEARRLMRSAFAADRRATHVARLLLAWIPPLGRRVWRTKLWQEASSRL